MNTQPVKPLGYIIRQPGGKYAAKFHRNLAGRQVTWTTDVKGSRFQTICEALTTAYEHGLDVHTVEVAILWPESEAA
jgi:hypothetical protein